MKIEHVLGHEKSQTIPENTKIVSRKASYKLVFHFMNIDAKMPPKSSNKAQQPVKKY